MCCDHARPVLDQAADVIDQAAADLRTAAVHAALVDYYQRHGVWPPAGGLAVDLAAYVRTETQT